jgi:hypothetical protein
MMSLNPQVPTAWSSAASLLFLDIFLVTQSLAKVRPIVKPKAAPTVLPTEAVIVPTKGPNKNPDPIHNIEPGKGTMQARTKDRTTTMGPQVPSPFVHSNNGSKNLSIRKNAKKTMAPTKTKTAKRMGKWRPGLFCSAFSTLVFSHLRLERKKPILANRLPD